jgi:cytochrome c oxidase subunit II
MPAALRAAPKNMPIRATSTALFGALLTLLVSAPAALADAITPEHGGGSPNAENIHTLYVVALILGAVIFVLVEGVLVYCLIKFRYKRGGAEAAQIRGNTPLEVGWTVGAAVLLVILAVVTFIYLPDIKNPAGPTTAGLPVAGNNQYASIDQSPPPGDQRRALRIGVNGQQYIWRYTYPNGAFSYYDMVVPYDTTVILDITSSDVAHSWWIPKLGGKADAIPPASKYVNHTWFRISKQGNKNYKGYTGANVFQGACAELCGENHADMRMRVIALPPDQYLKWVAEQKNEIAAAEQALQQQRKTSGSNQ